MANKKHVSMLKQGVTVWNKWREDNLNIIPDLSLADLSEADLSEADLSEAVLRLAILHAANLREAVLSGANLRGADLREADLSEVDLGGADLREADLREADLRAANLRLANLSGANLSGANLREADLSGANLGGANLGGADLSGANFSGTILGNVDLSDTLGLKTVHHIGPSTVGIDTIYASKGNIPEMFLRGAGVPDSMIVFMKSLTGAAIDFYSCFISHSSQDKPFVERLYADLQAKGVRCWYAPEDLKIGEPFLLGIEQGIRLHEKLLLVLSEFSVASQWVEHEVLSAMGKSPGCLFPIRVDNAIMNTNISWATMIKKSRHIGDFTQWKDHDNYQKAFDRLLRDLKAEK